MRRVGIDVGGTNTDAVLIDQGRVLAKAKRATTEDVTTGILAALGDLGRDGLQGVGAVMIGTTHFINAVVQRCDLSPVAALRIGAPATSALPPCCDWPDDLRSLALGGSWTVPGGHEFDGRRFMPLDEGAVRRAARQMRELGLGHVAISALFSPIDPTDEHRAAALVRDEMPGASITCSAEIGGLGLLERENAALFNATLRNLAARTIAGFREALKMSGLEAPLYITQNDGTVADAGVACDYPVYSFASGATNSMRGAAFLSGLTDALVADVGGTTTDLGEIKGGFPREANATVRIGGVRTFFRMPDLLSIGLGGGSVVRGDRVGPDSVGYRLTAEALIFGGSTLTATDMAVASEMTSLGTTTAVAQIQGDRKSAFAATVKCMIEDGIESIKAQAGDVPLIAVGGASFLVPDRLDGVSSVIRVEHGECANAIGAAIAQVSGAVDQVFQGQSRDDALAAATALAKERAIAAGASEEVRLVELDDIPIPYLPGDARRIRARVVGDIAPATPVY